MDPEKGGHAQEATVNSVLTDGDTIVGSPQNSSFRGGPNGTIPEIPRTIPVREKDEARTLVLCFDGTGDQFDDDNSNIVEFFEMLKKDDRNKQMVYYQAGIGTYISHRATPMAARLSKVLDEAVGWNLSSHIVEGYEFLMEHYIDGDRICIFGFSRGAYTARSLAGMICKVGLLPASNRQQIRFAYNMFARDDNEGFEQSRKFKKAFSIDVPIEFIGVWDTVDSVGIIPRRLPFTVHNRIVRTFRHAIALDERRAKFKAQFWKQAKAKNTTYGGEGEPVSPLEAPTAANGRDGENGVSKAHRQMTLRDREKAFQLHNHECRTDIQEVWFAGCHCDVGGGSVENDTQHALALIPLRWMVRECFKTKSGIMFKSEGLRAIGIDPSSLHPEVRDRPPPLSVSGHHIQRIPRARDLKENHVKKKRQRRHAKADYENPDSHTSQEKVVDTKTEEEHELLDALSPIYDQLSLSWPWWLLEVIPIKRHKQKNKGFWAANFRYRWNRGDGRYIPGLKKRGIKIHRSVQMRMEAEYDNGDKYWPKALIDKARKHGTIEWVD